MKQPKEEDWVIVCKKCGDELGIVYEPKEPKYLYLYEHKIKHNILFMLHKKTDELDEDYKYIGKIKLEDTKNE